MKKIKPKNFADVKTMICDWTDKKQLVHYRMLKFFVRDGRVVDKFMK